MVNVRFVNSDLTRTGYFIWHKANLKGLLHIINHTYDIPTIQSIREETKKEFLQEWMKNEILRACNRRIEAMELEPRTTWAWQFRHGMEVTA